MCNYGQKYMSRMTANIISTFTILFLCFFLSCGYKSTSEPDSCPFWEYFVVVAMSVAEEYILGDALYVPNS